MIDQDEAEKTNGPDKTDSKTEDSDDAEDLWAAAMAEQQAQETPAESAEADQEDDEEDLWAAAMAEQAQAPVADKQTNERSSGSNAQQTSTGAGDEGATQPRPEATSTADKQVEAEAAGERVFRPLEQSGESAAPRDLAMILDIPVRLSVELGRTKVTIKQLLEMAQGSVVELDGLAGEPMDILINGYLIAQGEVVVVEDKYGIRITEIVTPSERVQKLNR